MVHMCIVNDCILQSYLADLHTCSSRYCADYWIVWIIEINFMAILTFAPIWHTFLCGLVSKIGLLNTGLTRIDCSHFILRVKFSSSAYVSQYIQWVSTFSESVHSVSQYTSTFSESVHSVIQYICDIFRVIIFSCSLIHPLSTRG